MGLDYKATYGLADNEVPIVFRVPLCARPLWRCIKTITSHLVSKGLLEPVRLCVCCEFINSLCLKYPGIRVLMVRQFRSTMTQSCMYSMGGRSYNHLNVSGSVPPTVLYIYPRGLAKLVLRLVRKVSTQRLWWLA
jgi:hypothetical protein